jgi:hypothetical protein
MIAMTARSTQLETLSDAHAAAAFRRLVRHLRHRHDAQNIDLMGLAGFLPQLPGRLDRGRRRPAGQGAAREVIHGMSAADLEERYQTPATAEQLARMEEKR